LIFWFFCIKAKEQKPSRQKNRKENLLKKESPLSFHFDRREKSAIEANL